MSMKVKQCQRCQRCSQTYADHRYAVPDLVLFNLDVALSKIGFSYLFRSLMASYQDWKMTTIDYLNFRYRERKIKHWYHDDDCGPAVSHN